MIRRGDMLTNPQHTLVSLLTPDLEDGSISSEEKVYNSALYCLLLLLLLLSSSSSSLLLEYSLSITGCFFLTIQNLKMFGCHRESNPLMYKHSATEL